MSAARTPPNGSGNRTPILSIRVPRAMRKALDAAAIRGGRTRSAEILLRLEYTLDVDHRQIMDQVARRASEPARGIQR